MIFRLMLGTTVFSLLAISNLQAAIVTVPTGLLPGEQYRLAFVTSGTRNASSSDIGDYNAFVQAAADAVPELLSLGTTWNAIGSTFAVDARDNTGTNPNLDVGVPIFLLNETILADNNSDLWDGSIQQPLQVNENGVLVDPFSIVWTGSEVSGVGSDAPLGIGAGPMSGRPGFTNSGWIKFGINSAFAPAALYAMSEVLTVIPEPSSFMLLCLVGMSAIGGYPTRSRRCRR